ncbi:MAG: hypothetical protein WA826_01005 [Silvibacterium sp.]
MQASIKAKKDGSVNLQLDIEAARTIFASVLFASRFHDAFAPLVQIAKTGLRGSRRLADRSTNLCQ